MTLRGGLPERLVATVVTTWADRLAHDSAPASAIPSLTLALTSRARLAVQAWIGDPWADVDVTMLPPDAIPTLTRSDGAVTIEVPFSWLTHVRSFGLAHLLGRFTLAVRAEGRRLTLDTVGPALDREALVIELG